MPFNINLDLFTAIQRFIEARKLNEWLKLGIQLFCSFWFGGCGATGSSLVAHRPPWEALGSGLVMGSVCAVIVWRRSPLTKGLILALPEQEAREEMKSDTQVIMK